jgi:hypothetical protein
VLNFGFGDGDGGGVSPGDDGENSVADARRNGRGSSDIQQA